MKNFKKNKYTSIVGLRFINLLILIIITSLIESCGSKKNIVYLQYDSIIQSSINNDYKLRFKPDDLLQIIVSAENIESAQPFNLPIVATTKVGNNTFISQPQIQPYLIDSEGFIEFPILGKVKLNGLTRSEAIEKLKLLLSPDYLKNPVININISNFKITVQGEVLRPGTFTLPNERLSIFDAIGLAGDLKITARRDNVLLIREENERKIEYRLNLLSKSIFSSPAYYMQQNDVIYVEPNYAKIQDAAYTRNTGLFISLASVLISLITILTR